MTATAPPWTPVRLAGIDRLRGLAIVLMVIDHTCILVLQHVQVPVLQLVRLTATRASLPLFCVCCGYLLSDRRPRTGRWLRVAWCGVLCSMIAGATGLAIGQPDVLVLIALVLIAAPWLQRWPLVVLCVGVVQSFTWSLEVHGGYQLGVVAALIAGGLLARRASVPLNHAFLDQWWERLGVIGRYPLSIYVGHLLVLGWLNVMWGAL